MRSFHGGHHRGALSSQGAAVLSWLLAVPWAAANRLNLRRAEQGSIASAGYLIASFPGTRQVNYARLPDCTWLPLVPSTGITSPEALAVDAGNRRLFVADPSVGLVYWYHLEVLEDGRLITNGMQRLAASGVSAKGLAVDSVGTLYISGQGRGESCAYGIFKQDAAAFAAQLPPVPPAIWTPQNANVSGVGVQLVMPGGIAVDPFHVYWGNAVREQNGSSVVQAASSSPNSTLLQAAAYSNAIKASLRQMADNVDEVRGLTLTPQGVLYAAPTGVYGARLNNAGQGCGANSDNCPLIASMQDPTSLVWDGDGSVLVADRGAGRIFSFPSGTIQPHMLAKVVDAPGVFGLAMLPEKRLEGGEEAAGSGGSLLTQLGDTLAALLG
mmetsp:Transcript_115682/g.338363  ORF Transcript_115682/g.338363 Transcript_115682/m.338363 type:complete len:383 (-) Transcript_115682:22-1170(-)